MAGIKLYDIPMEFAALEIALVEAEGELSPELEKQFDEFMRGGKDKIEAAAMVVRTLEAEAEMCGAQAQAILESEVKRLKDRQQSHSNNASRLKALVLRAVDAAFDGKVKTSLFTIYGQTSAPTLSVDLAPEINIEDLEVTNPDLIRKKLELNKDAIKTAYKNGGELPDSLIVSEVPGTRFLRIR
jgi:hypothetical protein